MLTVALPVTGMTFGEGFAKEAKVPVLACTTSILHVWSEPAPGKHPAQSTHRPQPSGTAELKGSAPGADTRQRRSQGRAAMPRTGGTGTRDAGSARSQRALTAGARYLHTTVYVTASAC